MLTSLFTGAWGLIARVPVIPKFAWGGVGHIYSLAARFFSAVPPQPPQNETAPLLALAAPPEEVREEKRNTPLKFALPRNEGLTGQQMQVLEGVERTVLDKRLSDQPIPVPGGVNACDMAADVVFAGRTATTSDLLNEAMGYFTGLMGISGAFASLNAYKAFKRATFTSDRWSTVSSSLRGAAGASQIGFALGYLANRITYVASAIKRVPQTLSSPSSLGQAAAYTGSIGDGGFAAFGGFLGLFSLVRMGELGRFGWTVRQNNSDRESLEFLLKEVEFDASSWFAKRFYEDPDFEAHCEEIGEQVLAEEVVAGQKEQEEKLSLDEAAVYLRGMITDEFKEGLIAVLNRYIVGDFQGWRPFALVGLIVNIQRHQAQKKEKVERCIGETLCHQIEKIKKMGMIPRLCSANKEIKTKASQECKELKWNIYKELFFRIGMHLALVSLSGLAVALGVMSIMMTVGLATFPPTTLLALTIAFTVFCFVLDVGPFKQGLFASKPNKLNYWLLALSTVFILASLATGLGLFIAGHFVTVELIKLVVTTVASLGINAYSLHRFKKREEEWVKEHPTLTDFKEALEAQNGEQALLPENDALFKKLSKEDRIAVREQMKLTSEYKRLKRSGHFEKSLNERDLVLRSVKKAVSRSWEQYNADQNEALLKRAWNLQILQDRLREGQEIKSRLGSVDMSCVYEGFAEIVARRNRSVLEKAVETVLNARS